MPEKNPKKWIQNALKKGKKGALSRQLGIPQKENIPFTLLRKIKDAEIGDKIHNPTGRGKRWITVTRLMKRRAVCALNLKEIRR